MRNLFVLVATCLLGCSSSSPSDHEAVTVTGSLGATPLALKSAGSAIVSDSKGSYALVYLSPFDDACGATAITTASQGAIELSLYQAGAGNTLEPATTAGVYSTDVSGNGPWAEIDVYARDASCSATDDEGKGDGMVTLTHAGLDGYAGSFTFTADGGTVTGTFSTDACGPLPSAACQQ